MKKILLVLLCVMMPSLAWAQQDSRLTVVQPEYVCMVNNQLFPNSQIAVMHDGKTYYGCCPMCKGRLQNDASMRVAIDPVSGAQVDKADAVIGALPDGKVLYFENIENLKHYK